MAEVMVIWYNLERTLESEEVADLPLPLRNALNRLLDIVGRARGAVAALEERDRLKYIVRRAEGNLAVLEGQDPIILRRGRLENLSTLLYKADDIVNQILTINLRARCHRRNQWENLGHFTHLVQRVVHVVSRSTPEAIFSLSSIQLYFSNVMVGQVKIIGNGLEALVRQLSNQFDSTNQPAERQFQHNGPFEPIQQTLTGRKDDKKNIVGMLLQAPGDGKSNVSVICMSGLPGVGKSALAKDIYDDHKIKGRFDLRMWIPVTNITDETQIIRQIVVSCINRSTYQNSLVHQNSASSFQDLLRCGSSGISTSSTNNATHQNEIEIYEWQLRNEIREKHYLLILDDVCLQKWQSLRDLLAGGARGSKILMTTRDPKLADLLKRETPEVQPYILQGLKFKKSWKLFRTLALDQDERYDPEMKRIRFEIANICKHVPLTIKVAARFIHGKPRDECLSFIEGLRLSRDQKKDVMDHVLYLSYSDLPTRLRACFGYCTLFPNDYTFNKHDLISLWIAQGFVNPGDGRSLEDAGEKYFMELSRRFFFDEVSTDDLGNILTCKMHHIIRRLASKFAAGVAKLQLTDSSVIYITDSKHVSVNCRGGSSMKLSSPLVNDPSLRTLIFLKEPDCDPKLDTSVCNQLISSYRRLRVLDLHDLGVKELPDSIGGQIHLRYLNLSNNDLVTLPMSLTRLYNLQTLKLNSCTKLKRLAINFGALVNLKRFEVDGCKSLTSMPTGLEKLTQLETLTRFVVGKVSSKQTAFVELNALRELYMLRGRLAIELTGDRITNIPEAEQVLINKGYLVELKISWAQTPSDIPIPSDSEILRDHMMIMENLKPNKNLKILRIEGYEGNDFPSWAMSDIMHSLPNLVIISIDGCRNCRFIPPFNELAHLRKLTLKHMANVQFIEVTRSLESAVGWSSVLRQDPLFFPSLQELTLHSLYQLEGLRREVATIQPAEPPFFPCLSKLEIWNCPKLTSFPSFAEVLKVNLRNVNHLLLEECAEKARRLKSKFNTTSLQIKGCPDLQGFEAVRNGLGGLPSLKYLLIESCDAIISLSNEVGKIPSLESLEISSCKELDLFEYPEARGRAEDVTSIVSSGIQSPWKNLKCLRDLKLRDIPKMKTLPDGLKHVKTLKSLWLSECQSLESLPEWISSLSALQHLRIESCHALKMLPEGLQDITSLMKVEITACPKLTKHCQEHKGKHWPKIEHAQVLLHRSRRYGYV